MTKKNIILLLLSCLLISLSKIVYQWKSPDINWQTKRTTHSCIYDEVHHTIKVTSMNNEFVLNYVENASPDCINPYFPSIHITTIAEHNAWLHVVYTDAHDSKWQQFIDTAEHSEAFPFYTLHQDFYDAPIWHYTLFSKPLSFGKGHAYAVKVNHQTKTIQCMGGIEWGFRLSFLRLRPIMITPSILTSDHWQKDWSVFKTEFQEYTSI